jgi:group II intron reverse transcriptase/maturase
MFPRLTRGDLRRESGGEVSRGRSSEEAWETRRSEGPKNKRQTKDPSSAEQFRRHKEAMNVLNEKGLEAILDPDNLRAAYLKVKANRGAAGVDGIGVGELAAHIRRHWSRVETKLRAGTYQPGLLRPVQIPKAGGGERELNIPTTQDRLIQQAIAQPLGEVFEPLFSEHSYGYRPGRSAHEAVRQMKRYVTEEGKRWVVDLDVHRFFDEVSHDILMHLVSQEVRNKQVLRLIGRYLRAGKLVNNRKVRHTGKGVPQGGPLSPLLANIYLSPLDRELEERGWAFIRYADDITLYAETQEEAETMLRSIATWIESNLKLRVNHRKSGTRPPEEGSFLGYRMEREGKLALSKKTVERFKAHVRALLDARRPWKWGEFIENWQEYVRGWWNYCKLSEWYEAERLSRWCRRHVRKLCWLRWHNWKGRRNALIGLGAKPYHVKAAHSSRGAWRMAKHPALQTVLNNQRLRGWGFITPGDLVEAGS